MIPRDIALDKSEEFNFLYTMLRGILSKFGNMVVESEYLENEDNGISFTFDENTGAAYVGLVRVDQQEGTTH